MIEAKDITVAVSCLFPNTDPIWMMESSLNKFGFQYIPYGLGEQYRGWIDIKVHKLLEVARNCPTSHILYSDARDAWFLTGPEEVAEKYNALGCPPLMLSAQADIFGSYLKWYSKVEWNESEPFRYVGTPGQLCEAKALAGALGWLQENFHVGDETVDPHGLPDDDPPWLIEYMAAHPGEVKFDHRCSIFMNAGSHMTEGMWETVLEVRGNRLYNKMTGEWPCLVHFNGGSSDALKGKWESLEAHWKAFGNTERPPWERQ